MRNGEAQEAERKKRAVALSSVFAAIFLTAFKLVIGLLSNSLGILSEAAHSGLDLVAALVTYFAVRFADRPADKEHHFGHGKVENFSALVETLLLLGTCVWIIYEAVHRLALEEVEIEASIWAFIVMAVSIIVDVSRSRALYRVARKYHSQALEADALHFQTDIWSSSVVIVGLTLVWLTDRLPQNWAWLAKADAVAALVVAGIVVVVSVRLGRQTIDALLDRAPEGLEEKIRAAISQVEQVQRCSRLRLRLAGPTVFVNATVLLDPNLPTALAHEITTHIEDAVIRTHPRCDVTVHVAAAEPEQDDIPGQIRALAARKGLFVHDIHLHQMEGGYHVGLDLELPGDLSLEQAHHLSEQFEEALQGQLDGLKSLAINLEAEASPPEEPGQEVSAHHDDLISQVQEIVAAQPHLRCQNVQIHQVDEALYVHLQCTCPGSLSVQQVDQCSAQLEGQLQNALPQIARFQIHVTPEE